MAFRYTSAAAIPADFRQVAESVLGPVDWSDEHSGYCACPGAHRHTTPTRERDCRVYLDADNGHAPTVHCFHGSCKEEIAAANFALRSRIGKATFRQTGQLGDGACAAPRPAAITDPFAQFLNACFQPEDILSIAPGMIPEGETRAVPEHGGVNLFTRDQWLEKARAKGGIQRLFSGHDGLFVRINPVQPKSNGADKDVTAFRHVLVESDKMSKERQERILRDSGLPIAALIDSGAHSVHAWVRVDAESPEEFHERREKVWTSLPGFEIDPANRNPSRYSRCPGGLRGDAVQRLLAVNLGPASYEEWERQCDTLGLSPALHPDQLATYDVSGDPNCVLGQRWLCRGGSLLIVGQSGIGKSTFAMQLALTWALELSAFSIAPVRPLKSLFIQAENDMGDMAEMFQGACAGMGLSPDQVRELQGRVIFYRDTIHSGADFAKAADILIQRHQPDLVWGDPLLNYIGDDASQQKVVSAFCGHLLNPISERTGVIWCLMHHTGKPPSDAKARSHWTGTDLAYSGLGSSALTNWAREVAVLNRIKLPGNQPPTFSFTLCKRRKRSGMKDRLGNPSETIFLRHADQGLCWILCDDPKPETPTKYTIGKKKQPQGRPKASEIPSEEFENAETLSREQITLLAEKYDVSISTVKRRWKTFRENKQKEDVHGE
jgi:RecA-family ATPase